MLKQQFFFYSVATRAALLALSFVLGLPSLCSLLRLLFQQCGTLCWRGFYVSPSPPLFVGSFPGHFDNTIVPYRQSLKFHFKNMMVPYQLPLRLTLRNMAVRLLKNTRVFSQCRYRYSNYLRYDIRIHTNVHTYRNCLCSIC